jgi:hypothetical protein
MPSSEVCGSFSLLYSGEKQMVGRDAETEENKGDLEDGVCGAHHKQGKNDRRIRPSVSLFQGYAGRDRGFATSVREWEMPKVTAH